MSLSIERSINPKTLTFSSTILERIIEGSIDCQTFKKGIKNKETRIRTQ